jgi:hypothetical protein
MIVIYFLWRIADLFSDHVSDQEAFQAAVAADKKKGVWKSSRYTLGFTGQKLALTIWQFQQPLQDRFQLYTSFSLSVVGIILHSIVHL